MPIEDFLLRLAAALGLGLLLGLDREIKHAPVGMRTFALVAVGSAVYTMLTLRIGTVPEGSDAFSVDPSRLIQGLIGGIGFLGAGAIIGSQSGDRVRGIATGAAIWVSGGIGVACGLGLYWEALSVTLLTTVLLFTTEWAHAKWGRPDEIIDNVTDQLTNEKDD